MRDKENEFSLEYLKNYFENISKGKIFLSEADVFNLLRKCEEKYFSFNKKIENLEQTKKIFDLLYSNIRLIAGIYKYRNDYNLSSQIYKRFEIIAHFAESKKIMKFISWISYSYSLSFLLYQNNEEFEAINRCNSITSEYFRKEKKKENYKRILQEEDKNPRTHSDYTIYLNYLYKISILGQLICAKVGAKDTISRFFFKQRYFLEKLLYTGDEPFYKNEFITDGLDVSFGSSIIHTVMDEKTFSKGITRFRINFRRRVKALWYSIFRWIAGYGEKPFNLLKASLVIVLIWAMIYSFIETTSIYNFMNYFYQSFFIFTTFGLFDDSILLNSSNKIWMSVEITLGIIFINGFIVILARKLLR
jgi:hypothetical protein